MQELEVGPRSGPHHLVLMKLTVYPSSDDFFLGVVVCSVEVSSAVTVTPQPLLLPQPSLQQLCQLQQQLLQLQLHLTEGFWASGSSDGNKCDSPDDEIKLAYEAP